MKVTFRNVYTGAQWEVELSPEDVDDYVSEHELDSNPFEEYEWWYELED